MFWCVKIERGTSSEQRKLNKFRYEEDDFIEEEEKEVRNEDEQEEEYERKVA